MAPYSVRDRMIGAFVGLMHGDRLGLPYETMTPRRIRRATRGQGVTKVVRIPKNHAFKEVAGLPLGSTSDDWGMSAATARAVIAHGPRRLDDFFQYTLARELADELRRCDIGYGTGTKLAIRQMDVWLRGDLASGRSPLEPAPKLVPLPGKKPVGSGNGAAIRIAPVAMSLRFHEQSPYILMKVGQMTHSDPRASIAAVALGMFFMELMELHRKYTGTERMIEILREGGLFSSMLAELEHYERSHRTSKRIASTDIVSRRMRKVLMNPATLKSNASLRKAVGTSVLAWESVPYAIGVFLRNLDDPQAAIREAVNGGGDTDSIASMVGGLIGLLHGIDALPPDWMEGKDARYATALACRFYKVLIKGSL